MASVRKSLNGALKMLGVVGGHGGTATDEELADGLDILYGLYHGMITNGSLGRMRDVVPQGDYVAGENQRVFRRMNEFQEITFPDLVSSCGSVGYTITNENTALETGVIPTTDYGRFPTRTSQYSQKRTIRDLAVIIINDEIAGTTDEAIYDAGQKKWFVISDLDHEFDLSEEHDQKYLNAILDEEAPLSRRDYLGFRSYLAMQLADMFGAELTPVIIKNAKNFERGIGSRYGEVAQTEGYPDFGVRNIQPVGNASIPDLNTIYKNGLL